MTQRRSPRKVHHRLALPERNVQIAPPFGEEVAQEVGFLIELMDLKPAEAILDAASGAGRHALELARRGYRNVTAMDLSDQLLTIGRKTAASLELHVNFVKGDPGKHHGADVYDAAILLGGGAFGLMESDDQNQAILEATYAALKPGGRLALTALNLLNLIRFEKDLSGFDPQTHYFSTSERVTVEGDQVEELPVRERCYVFPGIKRDLERTGFRNVIGFGAEAGRFSSRAISTDSPDLLVYAIKPKG
jgi:2-polyprenyl-3-methyl-5-hydroxy-6-metoxy-1,4-benzoquinol methylase